MGDYINREEAVEAIMDSLKNDPFVVDADTSQDFVDGSEEQGKEDAALLLQIPAADVRENRRGKWIKIGHLVRSYKCDQCGNFLDFDGVNEGIGDANFCPVCGADMRVQDDEMGS